MSDRVEPVLNPIAPQDVAVGISATDTPSCFRLWCAREALRQGETRLAGQMNALSLMVGRAMSALGWSVTLALAMAAASSAFRQPVQAVLPISSLVLAGIAFLLVIWPRGWGVPGDVPDWILGQPYKTELEMVEALAIRASEDCASNAEKLVRRSWCLRVGTGFMLVAVFVALGELCLAKDLGPAFGLGASAAG